MDLKLTRNLSNKDFKNIMESHKLSMRGDVQRNEGRYINIMETEEILIAMKATLELIVEAGKNIQEVVGKLVK